MNRVKFERLRDLPEDTSFLTDADWRELNKWRKAHATGGDKALLKAARDLMKKDTTWSYLGCVFS